MGVESYGNGWLIELSVEGTNGRVYYNNRCGTPAGGWNGWKTSSNWNHCD